MSKIYVVRQKRLISTTSSNKAIERQAAQANFIDDTKNHSGRAFYASYTSAAFYVKIRGDDAFQCKRGDV